MTERKTGQKMLMSWRETGAREPLHESSSVIRPKKLNNYNSPQDNSPTSKNLHSISNTIPKNKQSRHNSNLFANAALSAIKTKEENK